MRSKSIVLLALALGCGLVASIGISQVMDAKSKNADATEKQPVFVAMLDIQPNEELTAQNIKLEEWPKNIIPQGALTKLEEVEGKHSRMKLYAGEPILSSKLLGAADAVGAAKDIPEGYRVGQVKVDSVSGASNLILPGDRVDVLLFRQPPGSDQNATAAKIVLQDIKVFAVDTHTETEFSRNKTEQGEPISAKTISLLVTPQQSLILHAASEVGGVVRLVLRNPDDDVHVATQGATLADIFGPDQHSNRNKEQGDAGDGSQDKDDVSSWLEKQKGKVTTPTSAPVTFTPPRQMVVILGSTIKQVDLPSDGEPPRDQPTNDSNPQTFDGSRFDAQPGDAPSGAGALPPAAPPADVPPPSDAPAVEPNEPTSNGN
jgi:pilus assembly protein CpaB